MEPLNKLFLDLEVVFNPDYCVSHDKDEIEYIRKDAILEWLEERINDGDEEGLMTNQIANFAYKDVIEKINEL